MTTLPENKIKRILSLIPQNAVVHAQWLRQHGISNDLIQAYRKSGWLKTVGRGVYVKFSDVLTLNSALYSLQTQQNLAVHYGGKYALAVFHGASHFGTLSRKPEIYTPVKPALPQWFIESFQDKTTIFSTDFLPFNIGFSNTLTDTLSIDVSTPERAFLELLFTVPQLTASREAYEILELLPNLRPKLLQTLLLECKSVKVNRLFLFLAQKTGHEWFSFLDTAKINLGGGVRVIEPGGNFDKTYNIITKVGDSI